MILENKPELKNHSLLGLTPLFLWVYKTKIENFSYDYCSLPLCFLLEKSSHFVLFLSHFWDLTCCSTVHSSPRWPLPRSQVYQRFLDSDIIHFLLQKTSTTWCSWTKFSIFCWLLLELKQKDCQKKWTPESMLQPWQCLQQTDLHQQ